MRPFGSSLALGSVGTQKLSEFAREQFHFRPGIGFDTKLSHPDPVPHHILGLTPPYHDIVCFGPRPRPHGFWTTHPGIALDAISLNFGVPTEPELSELPKGLVLGRDRNIYIRLRGSTPLGDVGCYNPPP
ncbi:hypothetical protein DVH24_000128 [Malus domestica]|uniref:Uncharacterized protein n=1 Tax=Malus domestica TaxID=3750 RepID=A0A498IYL5_MALDO|nr:hypothetical protein DVH24_000128 [Malus domestica]